MPSLQPWLSQAAHPAPSAPSPSLAKGLLGLSERKTFLVLLSPISDVQESRSGHDGQEQKMPGKGFIHLGVLC